MSSDIDNEKRERIVKGMKSNFKDLKKRYGDRAKQVMYATATKMSKEEETVTEGRESEYSANQHLARIHDGAVKKVHLVRNGNKISSHGTETEAMRAWKDLSDNKGVKIVKESEDGQYIEANTIEE